MCDSLWLMISQQHWIQLTQRTFSFYVHGEFVCHREVEKNYCATPVLFS